MKIVSLNVGMPREVEWHERLVTTGIFKEPVTGHQVALRKLNLDGDGQADLTVHGGEYKAVYCYPVEHYAFWKKELGRDLAMGMFGENFTTEGLLENDVNLGDRFRVGSAEVVVTQPRLPCYKLGVRFGADDMVKRFLASSRTGFYLAVTREGQVGAGDEIELVERERRSVPVPAIVTLYVAKHYGAEELRLARRVMEVDAVPEDWKGYFRERIHRVENDV
jgi:MOSC domain-containing protein YiiM